jgi:hypothetical protein
MKIVASILNSIGRYENDEPINETLFSVVEHEDSGNYSLWIGLPMFDEKSYDLSHRDCLDLCHKTFWEDTMKSNIKWWLSYVDNLNEDTLEAIEEDYKKIKQERKDALYCKNKLKEVL